MKDSNNTCAAGIANLDRESWARPGDAPDLRLWLRMLTCSTLVENRMRGLMRARFGTTLPRFDLMAQLAHVPGGMKMSDLSRSMMVTNGNITGIADQLERDGLIERAKVDADRRSCLVRLTPKGRQHFRRMSSAYQGWLVDLFEELPGLRREQLHELLGELKTACLRTLPPENANRPH